MKRKKVKYDEYPNLLGRLQWTPWIIPKQKGYKSQCCDCGLTHQYDFRIVDGKVEFRVRIHKGETQRNKKAHRAAA